MSLLVLLCFLFFPGTPADPLYFFSVFPFFFFPCYCRTATPYRHLTVIKCLSKTKKQYFNGTAMGSLLPVIALGARSVQPRLSRSVDRPTCVVRSCCATVSPHLAFKQAVRAHIHTSRAQHGIWHNGNVRTMSVGHFSWSRFHHPVSHLHFLIHAWDIPGWGN